MGISVQSVRRLAACALAWLFPLAVAGQTFTNEVITTPAIVQDTFGPAGNQLPFGGQEYCCPTAVAMSLDYLGVNGFNQLAPSNPTTANELNLVRVLGGLMGTDQLNGTNLTGVETGITTYLQAEGISTSNFTLNVVNGPTISQMAGLNQSGTVVDTIFGYYYLSNGIYYRGGGHSAALLNQGVNTLGQSAPSTIVVNNPLPGALLGLPDLTSNSLQNVNLTATPAALSSDGSLMVNSLFGPATVLEQAIALTVNPTQQSANNPTPATWTLSDQTVLSPNGGNLTVLAPIQSSSYGITIASPGTVEFQNSDTAAGLNSITGGTWRSDLSSGTPFGTGTIQLLAGKLQIVAENGSGAAAMAAATGTNKNLTFSYGCTIALNRQQNSSLALQIGSYTDGVTANIIRGTGGTLVIAPASGIANLGTDEQLTLPGTGGNLPTLTHGMVIPYIVGQDNDSAGSGDFLTYGSTGIARAAYTEASSTPITSTTSSTVYDAEIAQTIPASTTASVYALKVGAVTIGGGSGSTLNVGPLTTTQSGVILNGGTISATNLNFGSAEGIIYASGAGGTINSVISAGRGLTVFGPGALTLTAANTFSNVTHINGTLIAANTSAGSATSSSVVVADNGTLQINTSATAGGIGGTTINSGGTLLLNGGSLTGPLTTNTGSFLLGKGTVSGNATVNGTIGGSAVDFGSSTSYPGVENVSFTGSATLQSTAYDWKLTSLDDNPADAGTNWSLLNFPTASAADLGTSTAPITVTLDLANGLNDPNSSDPFWSLPHQWDVATDPNGFASMFYTWDFPTYADGSFSVTNDTNSDNLYVDYTPVPEPTAIAFTACMTFLAIRRSRRRRD